MTWTDQAWNSIQPIFKKTISHPFIQELMNGNLPLEKFNFYIQQDSIYLSSYGKLLTGLASKFKDPEHSRAFIHIAGENMDQEKELHKSFIKEIELDIEPSPACELYTSYLLKHLAVSPVEVALAAVMPCFVIYQKVGSYIYKHQVKGTNPYQAWIDTYAGSEHVESVITATRICDEIARNCTEEKQEAMLNASKTSSRIEHMFWDSASNLEKWLV